MYEQELRILSAYARAHKGTEKAALADRLIELIEFQFSPIEAVTLLENELADPVGAGYSPFGVLDVPSTLEDLRDLIF